MVEYIYVATALVKIIAGALFFGGYLKSKRKSALFLSLGWMSALTIPSPSPGSIVSQYESIILGVSASLTLTGILYLLEEEIGRKAPKALHLSIPTIPVMYGVIEGLFGSTSDGTYVVVGILVMMAGVLSCELLSDKYNLSARVFGTVLSLTGALSVLKPIIYKHLQISPELNTEISLITAIAMAAAYYKIILSPKFVNIETTPRIERQNLKKGTLILSPDEFQEFTSSLENYPVLAFLRGESAKNGWIVYRLQTIEMYRTIHPRNIYQILEYSNRYLREMGDKNRGIVILDSPEFLRIYNDFPSIVKMLTSLSDMVKSHGGTLIIITVPETWEEREWKILKRVVL